VLADSGVQSDVKMAHLVAEPLRVHMGVLNSALRSPDKCLEHHVLAAQGKEGLLDALWGCSKVFRDMSRLATCGFMVEFDAPSSSQLTPEDPCVLADDAMARRLSRLAFTVIRHRLRSTVIWHMFAYPGKFALLLSADVQVVASSLTTLRADWAAWQELQQHTTPFHKKLKQRSLFRWTFVSETFQLAEQEGWQPTGKLKEQVKRSLHHFGQTKLVEDANQKLRDRERDNASQKLSDVRSGRGRQMMQYSVGCMASSRSTLQHTRSLREPSAICLQACSSHLPKRAPWTPRTSQASAPPNGWHPVLQPWPILLPRLNAWLMATGMAACRTWACRGNPALQGQGLWCRGRANRRLMFALGIAPR
jgi:hypothetical protein